MQQRQRGVPATLLGRALARPGVTVAGAAFAALMTGIVANAVFFQKGHHPAPLFDPTPPAQPVNPPQPPSRAETAPQPAAPAPAPVAPAAEAPPSPPPAALAPAPAPKPHPHKAAIHPHKDAIGDLIGTLGTSHKPAPAKPAAKPTPAHPRPAEGKTSPGLARTIAAAPG